VSDLLECESDSTHVHSLVKSELDTEKRGGDKNGGYYIPGVGSSSYDPAAQHGGMTILTPVSCAEDVRFKSARMAKRLHIDHIPDSEPDGVCRA